MSQIAKKYFCWGMQFSLGGAAYGMLEILWRGFTHLSMLIAGGACFCLLIRITKSSLCLFAKSIIGGLCITSVEFISGCVVNLWLGLAVWDYTGEPFSLYGQICIRYTLLWIALCAIVIPICRLALDSRKYYVKRKSFNAESFELNEQIESA